MTLARFLVILLAVGFGSSVASAQNTSTDTVRSRIPGDGAVKAEPKSKPNPVGQPATDYHPAVKTRPAAPPPSPVTTKPAKKSN
jgi:hypothetical protein